MARVRWEPNPLQSEVSRLFTTLFDTPTTRHPAPVRHWVPAIDLVEADDHYVLRADLPGLGQDDVTIEISDDLLTIAGERASAHESGGAGALRIERSFGSFRRALRLPDGIDAEAVSAGFDNGVLEVRIPKPAQRKPRRVAISVAGDPAAIDAPPAAV